MEGGKAAVGMYCMREEFFKRLILNYLDVYIRESIQMWECSGQKRAL